MSLSVDGVVNRDVELCQGTSLLKLELEDHWILVWRGKCLLSCYGSSGANSRY